MRTAILAGATGLIGSHLLDLLLKDEYYTSVIALSRKPLPNTNNKLRNLVLDFDKLDAHSFELHGDDVFCCLGTTMKQVGSKEKFRKVDFDYVVALGTITKGVGASQFLLVSSQGANSKSPIFYSRVKGEVEEAMQRIGFEGLHIFRPSLLTGKRQTERGGEKFFGTLMNALNFIIPKKYKSIEGSRVAIAMLQIAKLNKRGSFTHASDELQSY